jgi:hypothetical protein
LPPGTYELEVSAYAPVDRNGRLGGIELPKYVSKQEIKIKESGPPATVEIKLMERK